MHNGEAIEIVNRKKILWIHFDENLSWSYYVNNVSQSSYERLGSLHQFNCFTPYNVRQLLAETLIILKIRYWLVAYSHLPKYQIQQLQKTRNRVASYVLGRFLKEDDLIKALCWLPITELMDFSIANCCFSALQNLTKGTTRKVNKVIVERDEQIPLVIKFLLLSMIYQKLLE